VLQSSEAGDAVPAAVRAAAVPRSNQIAGVVQLVVDASSQTPIPGQGQLMVLHFRATAPSPGSRITLQLAAVGANGASAQPAAEAPLTLVVMP